MLLTRGAFDLARRAAVGKLEELGELRWQSHGAYRMKGVEEPVQVFEVGEEALAPLGPPPSSDKVTRLGTGEVSTASVTSAEAPRRPLFDPERPHVTAETWSLHFAKPPCYDAVMEWRAGRSYFSRDYPKALQLFERAVELDPGFFGPALDIASGGPPLLPRSAIAIRLSVTCAKPSPRGSLSMAGTATSTSSHSAAILRSSG